MSASPRPEANGAGDGQKAARCCHTGPERSARAMSQSTPTSAPAEQESTDTPTDDQPPFLTDLACDYVANGPDGELLEYRPFAGAAEVAEDALRRAVAEARE